MNEPAGSRPGWAVVIVISVVFLIYVWDRVIVPLEAVEIRAALLLSLPDIALLGSVFTFGLVLAAVPSGLFAARYGTQASLVLGAAVFSAATLWLGLAGSFGSLLALRVASGVGEGFYNVALLSFLGRMTHRHRSLAVGFPATLFGLGVFTAPPVIIALQAMTRVWRAPFVILGVAGLLGTATIWRLLCGEAAPPRTEQAPPRTEQAPSPRGRLADVLTPGTLAIYGTIAATGLIVYSYLSLLQGYLRTESGLGAGTAGIVFSLFGVGSAIGGVGMGALGDLVGRGRFVAVGTVLLAIVGAAVFWVTPSLPASGALSCAVGIGTNGIYCNSIALVQDRAGDRNIPIATGLLAIIYYLMSAFSGYVVARLALAVGWEAAGLLTYTVPYLLVAPFLFALVWRSPAAARPVVADALLGDARH